MACFVFGEISVKRVKIKNEPWRFVFTNEKEYREALHHFETNPKKYEITDSFWGYQGQDAKSAIYLAEL